MPAMETTRTRQYEPGSAEFVVALLTIKSKMCPHNPKPRSYAQSAVPSCLGFLYRDSTVILLLKTSSLCKACYSKAVPDGYLILANSIQHSIGGHPSAREDSAQWWQFRLLGFESYLSFDTIRLPLQIPSEEHMALQLFLGQARPFYLPLFHTMGKLVPKSLVDTDNAIASTHGVSLVNTSGKVTGHPSLLGTSTAMVSSRGGQDKERLCDLNHDMTKEDPHFIQGADG